MSAIAIAFAIALTLTLTLVVALMFYPSSSLDEGVDGGG